MEFKKLNIHSPAIVNNILDNYYGGYGDGLNVSFSVEWDKVPEAKSYAIVLIDFDATHVVGSPYIHWLACDIKTNKLEKNATHNNKEIVQGQNSTSTITWKDMQAKRGAIVSSELILKAANYFGPFPPDKSHQYSLMVFALDTESLNLSQGYFLDELYKAMKNHIIATDTLDFEYRMSKK